MRLHEHLNHKQVGNLYELLVASKLAKLGCVISFPYGENCAYDMIADYDNNLYRIQVKAPYMLSNGIYSISCVTTNNTHSSLFHGYSRNDIDLICSVIEDDLVCLSYHVFEGKQCISIRSNENLPKNNQIKGVRFVSDCDFSSVLQLFK